MASAHGRGTSLRLLNSAKCTAALHALLSRSRSHFHPPAATLHSSPHHTVQSSPPQHPTTAPMSFKIEHTDESARSGTFTTRHGTIDTPNLLIYTRRGGPLNLTPDVLQHLKPLLQALQMNTFHFVEHPGPDALEAFGKGVHELTAYEDMPIYAGSRDPCAYEHGLRPSSDSAAYVTVHSGGSMVSPLQFMRIINALKPDFYVALSDEVASISNHKRTAKSVDRTSKWLEECLKEHSRLGLGDTSAVFGAVQGGGSVEERARSAQAVADKDVQGFVLCGFGTGEAPATRMSLLAAAMKPLPRKRPVVVSGLGLPQEILQGIEAGGDLFDTSLVAALVEGGYALRFPLQPSAKEEVEGAVSPDDGGDRTKLNLWSISYRLDAGPLVAGCSCWTCKNHTRAYIHHLLQVHEMLAGVLLEVHNTHYMLTFMQEARRAIKEKRFQEFKKQYC